VPAVALSTAPAAQGSGELLIVPVFEQDDLRDLDGLDQATGGDVSRAIASGEFRGKLYELFLTPAGRNGWRAKRVALVGAGPRGDFTTEHLRRTATAAALAARQRRIASISLVGRAHDRIDAPHAAQALAEGIVLANFNGGSYKTGDEPRVWIDSAELIFPGGDKSLERAIERGRVLGECSNVARELANEPSNALTPRIFADRAADLAKAAGLTVEILDETKIGQLGMGLLLGVAQGSLEPPRVIVLKHEPKGAPPSPVLGLIGKGITFDTGGISIKPALYMEDMKGDMSGGAAVVEGMGVVAELGLPLQALAVVAATENAVGGGAYRPGDILTAMNGKTIEITNTDAEGRLVLADALHYARTLGATHLVDFATLTGAMNRAFGDLYAGVMGNDDAWRDEVVAAGEASGDHAWPWPMHRRYRGLIESAFADMKNSSVRGQAQPTYAASFLEEFVGEGPWAHVDVAGTAFFTWGRNDYLSQKGGTGYGVRLIAELATKLSA
jgi:leucyl aminopeptidase